MVAKLLSVNLSKTPHSAVLLDEGKISKVQPTFQESRLPYDMIAAVHGWEKPTESDYAEAQKLQGPERR